MSGFVFAGIAYQLNVSWTLDEPLPMDRDERLFGVGYLLGMFALFIGLGTGG